MDTYEINYDPLPIASSKNNLLLVGPPMRGINAVYHVQFDGQDLVQIPATGLSLQTHLRYKINRFSILCSDSREDLLGTFFVMKNHNADWEHRKDTFMQAIEEYNTGLYHPRVLELLIEFQIYHALSVKINFAYWHRFASSEIKLRGDEVSCLVQRLRLHDGSSWFSALTDLIRTNGSGMEPLSWALSDPATPDSLSRKERERIAPSKRRILHLVDASRAAEILGRQELPVGSFLLRPCFTSRGNLSASYKISELQVGAGIFEEALNARCLMLAYPELAEAVVAAPLAEDGRVRVVDKWQFSCNSTLSPAAAVQGYQVIFRREQGRASKRVRAVDPVPSSYLAIPDEQLGSMDLVALSCMVISDEQLREEGIELLYHVKGETRDAFRQLFVKQQELSYETLKARIERQACEDYGRVRKVARLLEMRGSRRIVIGRSYRRSRDSGDEIEVEFVS